MNRSIARRAFALVALVVAGAASLVTASAASANPSNDDIAAATNITSTTFTNTVDTTTATVAADDPPLDMYPMYFCRATGSVWYKLTASAKETLVVDTIGSSYDTTLAAFSGSPGSLAPVDCNDDASFNGASRLYVPVEVGTTYYFMVGCYSTCGQLTFNVEPSATITVIPDGKGSFNSKAGTATVTGAVRCNLPVTGEISSYNHILSVGDPTWAVTMLRQKWGRSFLTVAISDDTVLATYSCTPKSPGRWSITFKVDGKFAGGNADATVWSYAQSTRDSTNYAYNWSGVVNVKL